jgi:CheY-like chemotaxis protein
VGETHHVLVVDDEPYIGRIIRMQFEQGPYRVSTASDGPVALGFLRDHEDVELVMVDINLPTMSGLDLIAQAQEDPRLARLRFVVLTAAGQDALLERARSLGVAAFVTKPFSPKKLYQQVGEVLGLESLEPDIGGEG